MKIVNVQFKKCFVIHKCDAGEENYKPGDIVMVNTKKRGLQTGTITSKPLRRDPAVFSKPVNTILRLANYEDQKRDEEKEQKAAEALRICKQKIERLNLSMKLVDVNFSSGGEKATFFFIAEKRVNFRELVKQLASELHTRIELRQIGARNEAQIIGGVGCCGRPMCCASFLSSFKPVSIRMAKDQGLSLDPSKISGLCGRLLCCLAYETDTYEALKKDLPAYGSRVTTVHGEGKVVKINVISQTLSVELKDGRQVNISSEEIKNTVN